MVQSKVTPAGLIQVPPDTWDGEGFALSPRRSAVVRVESEREHLCARSHGCDSHRMDAVIQFASERAQANVQEANPVARSEFKGEIDRP